MQHKERSNIFFNNEKNIGAGFSSCCRMYNQGPKPLANQNFILWLTSFRLPYRKASSSLPGMQSSTILLGIKESRKCCTSQYTFLVQMVLVCCCALRTLVLVGYFILSWTLIKKKVKKMYFAKIHHQMMNYRNPYSRSIFRSLFIANSWSSFHWIYILHMKIGCSKHF